MSARRTGGGFTLVEIMIAVGIMASLTVLIWGSFNQSFKSKKQTEAQMSRYRAARIAMDRMIRDVSMAYLSNNSRLFRTWRSRMQSPRTAAGMP